MKAKLLGLVALLTLLGLSEAGAVTLVGTTTDAMGIDGLVVDGVTYNVTFENASYDTVYMTMPPTFLGNFSGAQDAANALASALNVLEVTNLAGLILDFPNVLYVPYVADSFSNQGIAVACPFLAATCNAGEWFTDSDVDPLPNSFVFFFLDYPVFQVAPTPLPPAFPLFATGLGALGWLGGRRNRKNAAAIVVA
jgi:hypothetical protein